MIRFATKNDVPEIQKLARITWMNTYLGIISTEQIEFMLEKMYSTEKLTQAIETEKFDFLVFEAENNLQGFCSIEHFYQQKNSTRIHKLYILPEAQGKKIGKQLLDKTSSLAIENKSELINLNVNKHNSGVQFYQKNGFEIFKEEVIDIGNGFVMDDFIMTKRL